MRLDTKLGIDEGYDINVGDIVFIKFEVIEPPTNFGDVKLRYYPRRGHDEYAARKVNAVFIKRFGPRWLQNIWNWLARYI